MILPLPTYKNPDKIGYEINLPSTMMRLLDDWWDILECESREETKRNQSQLERELFNQDRNIKQ